MGKNKRMLGTLVAVVPLVLGVTGCHQHHHQVSAPTIDMSGPHFTPSRGTGDISPVGYEMLQKDKHALLSLKNPGACAPHSRPGSQCAPTKSIKDLPSRADIGLFISLMLIMSVSQNNYRSYPQEYGLPPIPGKEALLNSSKEGIYRILDGTDNDGSRLNYFKDKQAAIPHLIDELWERPFNPETVWDLLDWSGEYGFTDVKGHPGEIDYTNYPKNIDFPKYRRPGGVEA